MDWKYFGKLHEWLYRVSGGRLGARMGWIDVALLEVIGRKTGEQRVVPVACYPYRDSIVVSASNSGAERHPAWYLNMQADPNVTVQLGREKFPAVAVEVPEEERDLIVQPFYQGREQHRGSGQAGLGLAIVRRILELHRSRLVVGEAEGGGARFCFTLPLSTGNA